MGGQKNDHVESKITRNEHTVLRKPAKMPETSWEYTKLIKKMHNASNLTTEHTTHNLTNRTYQFEYIMNNSCLHMTISLYRNNDTRGCDPHESHKMLLHESRKMNKLLLAMKDET